MLKVTKRKAQKPLEKLPHDGNSALDKALPETEEAKKACIALVTTKNCAEGVNTPMRVEPDKENLPDIVKQKRLKMTGKHLPVVHCNVCPFADTCPKYKSGYECAYAKDFMKRIETMDDLRVLMKSIVEADLMRTQQALIFEQLKGGIADDTTTSMLDNAFNKLKVLHELSKAPDNEMLTSKGKGVIDALFGELIRKAKPSP